MKNNTKFYTDSPFSYILSYDLVLLIKILLILTTEFRDVSWILFLVQIPNGKDYVHKKLHLKFVNENTSADT